MNRTERSRLCGAALLAAFVCALLAACTSDPGAADAGACAGELFRCGSECVDTETDARHCGGCDRVCGAGETCVGGRCGSYCRQGSADCNGDAADGCETATGSDPAHCGACGAACPAGVPCFEGSCGCPADRAVCEGACVDTRSSAVHCGACGLACEADQVCSGGVCASTCAPPYARCGDACVDLQKSVTHCGACGHPCVPGRRCLDGACEPECSGYEVRCGRECADLRTSTIHCGSCDRACEDGRRCAGGACVCAWPLADCLGRCVDARSDARNCGACNRACEPSVPCIDGRCGGCVDPQRWCDGRCVALASDAGHCGACGHACGASEVCSDGACAPCPEGHLRCDGACVDVRSSAAHCGACGNACPADMHCVASRCVDPPIRPTAPVSTSWVTSGRPWLRWRLPRGADGARVEVCASRSCDHVEARWDATGDRLRAPTALAPGVHFWRVYARRGTAVDAAPSPWWEFFVPDATTPPELPPNAVLDVNGDGFADRVDGRAVRAREMPTRWVIEVSFGAPAGSPALPGQVIDFATDETSTYDDGFGTITSIREHLIGAVVAAGDLNGDGYGDVLVPSSVWSSTSGPTGGAHSSSGGNVYLGGPGGLATTSVLYVYGDEAMGGVHAEELSAWAVGDADGDGFGDMLSVTSSTGRSAARIYGGPRPTDLSLRAPYDYFFTALVGDFDGDGTSDRVDEGNRFRRTPAFAVATIEYGGLGRRGVFFDQRDLPPCAALDPPSALRGQHYRVLDADGDGYDDLRIDETSSTPPVAVLYRGGPGGLSSSRCARLP